jgi:hypothetical protein
VTAQPSERQLDTCLVAICGLAWASGVIHVQAAIDHFDVSQLEATLFEALAIGQFLWGVAVYRSPQRWLLVFGAVTSVLVAAAWAMSRTVGMPIGPDTWTPESVGLIDTLATVDELMLATAVFALYTVHTGRVRVLIAGAAIGLLLLSSLSLVGGGAHVH